MSKSSCPLCDSKNLILFHRDDTRPYYRCTNCYLVSVPSQYHLSPKEEKRRYDDHENDPNDQNYRQFLNRLFEPLNKMLSPNSKGLDFGAGPGPTLHLMFEEAGYTMDIYDIFYADNPAVFEMKYDFITATEVIEHLHNPVQELNRLWSCLKLKGFLGIMTKRVISQEAFKNWHYIRDKTHVAFFSETTFEWIAKQWEATLSFPENDVVIFRKISEE